MVVSLKMVGVSQDIEGKLANLSNVEASPEILQDSLQQVLKEFNELGATDQVAKGSVLVGKLLS